MRKVKHINFNTYHPIVGYIIWFDFTGDECVGPQRTISTYHINNLANLVIWKSDET